MKIKTDFILKGINIIVWLVFLGFCIQTGALLFTYVYSLFRSEIANDLYLGLDLSNVYNNNIWLYTFLVSLIIALSALKAYVFFLAIKVFKKMNLVKPFSEEIAGLISRISYYVFSIGLLGYISFGYAKNLTHKGLDVTVALGFWNDFRAYLLMAGIIFVIAQVFKKGIEIQRENDLTI